MRTRTWTATILISEEESTTKARAVLTTEAGVVEGEGTARTHPGEPNVPGIGDEIAASRALFTLGHALSDLALEELHNVLQKA